jgi:hypothetical protein
VVELPVETEKLLPTFDGDVNEELAEYCMMAVPVVPLVLLLVLIEVTFRLFPAEGVMVNS